MYQTQRLSFFFFLGINENLITFLKNNIDHARKLSQHLYELACLITLKITYVPSQKKVVIGFIDFFSLLLTEGQMMRGKFVILFFTILSNA